MIAIVIDADGWLVPLAFGLVEKDKNESWLWFLRLVRKIVIEPGSEVGVNSNRHAGILNACQEEILGHAHVHHRWCTCHLATSLVDEDHIKDNFKLFEEMC